MSVWDISIESQELCFDVAKEMITPDRPMCMEDELCYTCVAIYFDEFEKLSQ